MKAIGVVLLSFFVSNAHASWMSVKCSNSDGTVNWESSTDEGQINLKYANFVEGTLTLNTDQVIIEMSKELTINEKTVRTCTFSAMRRVYAGKVKITAADKHPDVLRGQFPENKVQTEVICTMIVNNELPCTDEE